MAVIVIPVMTDDLDPSVCTHAATWGKVVTVAFGLDGVSFEIQLGDINEKALREIFAPYVEHARPARPLVRKGKHTDTARRAQEIIRCRAWAKEKGYPVSDNGRLPDAIIAKYREQHPEASSPPSRAPSGRA
jgi:hypothetical protein